jgi:hypothetical protein
MSFSISIKMTDECYICLNDLSSNEKIQTCCGLKAHFHCLKNEYDHSKKNYLKCAICKDHISIPKVFLSNDITYENNNKMQFPFLIKTGPYISNDIYVNNMESIFKQIDDCEYFYADLRNGNLFQIVSEIGYAYSKGKPIFLNLETLNVDNAFLYALSYKSLNSIVNNRKNKLRFFEHDNLLPEGMRDLMFYYGQLKTLLLN